MIKIYASVKQFVLDETGITAIEYGLIAALMVAAIITGMLALGPQITALFIALGDKLVMTP